MRLPRLRVKTLMVLVALIALACAVGPVLWLLVPEFRFHGGGGGKEVPVDFLVVDELTGQPVAGAVVDVEAARRSDLIPPNRGMTGKAGRVRVPAMAWVRGRSLTAEHAGGRPVTLWWTETVSLAGGRVKCEAPGYQPVERTFGGGPPISVMAIRLRPSPARRLKSPTGGGRPSATSSRRR